ncbi:hypothetical protein V5735_20460 (plasmid) [Haladaptatus sp. SPP-AMP-3]|uniref:hypothetical protein n=1 Tax=Haladaptatus sp. SPP-AMP-3 TaxID=3121295 RepID=UPI003C2C56AC
MLVDIEHILVVFTAVSRIVKSYRGFMPDAPYDSLAVRHVGRIPSLGRLRTNPSTVETYLDFVQKGAIRRTSLILTPFSVGINVTGGHQPR